MSKIVGGSQSSLADNDSRNIMQKSFVIDCCKIVIRQNVEELPKNFCGSGYISQTAEGQFTVKVYCNEKYDNKEALVNLFPTHKAGTMVPKKEFYSLSAYDLKGNVWNANNILLELSYGNNEEGIIIFARIGELERHSKCLSSLKASMVFTFEANFDIPFNEVTSVHKCIGSEKRGESLNLNIAKFSACNYKCEIEKDDDNIVLTIISDSEKFPEFFDIRVCEALQVIFAQSISWVILEVYEKGIVITRIRSFQVGSKKTRIMPPLSWKSWVGPKESILVWNLFEKYIKYILTYSKEQWHPLSGYMHSAIESSSGSLEAQGLTLSVSIEGILKTEFPGMNIVDDKIKKQIENAIELIASDEMCDETFKNRIKGLFGSMLQPSIKDKLHVLVKEGLIKEKLVKSWGKIRNGSVHPDSNNKIEISEYIKLCDDVTVLFYLLIFKVIGYSGKYSDYSSDGWPIKDFNTDKLDIKAGL